MVASALIYTAVNPESLHSPQQSDARCKQRNQAPDPALLTCICYRKASPVMKDTGMNQRRALGHISLRHFSTDPAWGCFSGSEEPCLRGTWMERSCPWLPLGIASTRSHLGLSQRESSIRHQGWLPEPPWPQVLLLAVVPGATRGCTQSDATPFESSFNGLLSPQ